jgi:hypothetical protein
LKNLLQVCNHPFWRCALRKKSRIGGCAGFGKENASALIKALEKEVGVEVKAWAAG